MKLIHNWRDILKQAWSVRLIILAGILTAAEVVLPLFFESIPRNVFAVAICITTAAALIARLIAQKGLDE
jgi:hypothetical protein